MQPDPDELAGVVDLFGGLTRPELRDAFADLGARSGDPVDPDALSAAVDESVEGYYLVAIDWDGGAGDVDELLVAGPTALPTLPEGGGDLPHLLDVDHRSVDPDSVGHTALSRLHRDAARAVDAGDRDRIATLRDVCYDLESWRPVETGELRDRLDDEL